MLFYYFYFEKKEFRAREHRLPADLECGTLPPH